MTRTLLLSALSAVIVALGGYAYLTASQSVSTSSEPFLAVNAQESGADAAETTDAEAGGSPDVTEMAMGDADAPITVIEYASMTCPHCARFHQEVYPQLVENYVETGQVRFVMREVYFDRFGLWAGMVARCGGEMRYFGIVEMLMEEQREWVQGQPTEVAANLRRLGRRAGLSDEALDACMSDNDMAQAMVTVSTEQAEADEITGTPSFVINGELYSNMGYATFADTLDGLLAEIEG
ncbi:MAG: thiol-disulfide oxidoreductase [Rhodobacteraceae bacterium CG17_big_fil_post_rev_8_21_14_2_50_65_11]|nr:MAG: thiol-disulfide oxidoreductase [Rhodobacteraceae bacterium CG17_big_fil_post_rev_8_21_14_2_50_65_11]